MTNLKPELIDLLEQVREVVLGLAGTEESFPWRTRTFSRDFKGCNFLFVNEFKNYFEISVHLPPRLRKTALQLPNVEKSKSMGERGWIVFKITNKPDLENLLPYIEESYKFNKPVRKAEDLNEDENSKPLEFLESIRSKALTYGDVEEFFPYGSRAFRPRKGHIFAFATEYDDYLYVTVRLPVGVREYALNLDWVEVPKYLGHRGWIVAKVSTIEQLTVVLPWVDFSFELNNPARSGKTGSKK